jgi:Saxitoxin biosynthesis operon protein SxtJ
MLQEDIKEFLKSTTRDLRKFGLMVGAVFCLLAVWFWLRHRTFFWYVLVPGVPLMALGAIWPRSLKWIYVGWMTLATMVGMVVSTILLTLLFYVVVAPVGLFARAVGKDFLSQKLNPEAPSYWVTRDASRPKQKHEHEQQF